MSINLVNEMQGDQSRAAAAALSGGLFCFLRDSVDNAIGFGTDDHHSDDRVSGTAVKHEIRVGPAKTLFEERDCLHDIITRLVPRIETVKHIFNPHRWSVGLILAIDCRCHSCGDSLKLFV
ncbi:hypothetical protein AOQ73_26710 [Bradyrhizobium pachyrhizi]|nr:hypothetical protein AOQ73_26710 [Bradyrhizobium pachyrhizi]